MIHVLALAVIALFLAMAGSRSEPHIHGGNVPDWYDQSCCNNRDCKPLEKADEPEAIMHGTEPAYRWRGLIFTKEKFKTSRDERFHVCVQPHTLTPVCIYLPAMI